jgi:hypothetical protein
LQERIKFTQTIFKKSIYVSKYFFLSGAGQQLLAIWHGVRAVTGYGIFYTAYAAHAAKKHFPCASRCWATVVLLLGF